MEDILTEIPPPSRFFDEDLDNFALPSPPLASPFLLLQNPNPNTNPNYNLLIFLISPQSLSLLNQIPSKTLISSLFLPELPLSSPSSPISIFSLSTKILIAAVPCRVSPSRAKAVAKLLLKNFDADRTVVFDSIDGEKYRGRIEEAMVVKMETKEERKLGLVRGVQVVGPGSLAVGLGAAVMVECEMRRRKGTLLLTWHGNGRGLAARVLKGLVRDLGVEVGDGVDDTCYADVAASSSSWLESDLYT